MQALTLKLLASSKLPGRVLRVYAQESESLRSFLGSLPAAKPYFLSEQLALVPVEAEAREHLEKHYPEIAVEQFAPEQRITAGSFDVPMDWAKTNYWHCAEQEVLVTYLMLVGAPAWPLPIEQDFHGRYVASLTSRYSDLAMTLPSLLRGMAC